MLLVLCAVGSDYDLSGFQSEGFVDGFFPTEDMTISTIDDGEIEGTEDFLIQLAFGIDRLGDFIIVREQTTVFILDNDVECKFVCFS